MLVVVALVAMSSAAFAARLASTAWLFACSAHFLDSAILFCVV